MKNLNIELLLFFIYLMFSLFDDSLSSDTKAIVTTIFLSSLFVANKDGK